MSAADTAGCVPDWAKARATETVGQSLDRRIQRAREQVEALCVLKAKAEALNILDFPQEFIWKLAFD